MVKRIATAGLASLLGAVAGNLVYHLLESHAQAQQLKAGTLPATDWVGATWVPHTTLAATFLATRAGRRPGALGFLLALAIALIVVAATRGRTPPVMPSTITAQ